MRLPRDLDGPTLARALGKLGYRITRQTGSHVRLTCETPSQRHITVPHHRPLRVGTLSAIVQDVAHHHDMSREDLLRTPFP